MSTDSSIRCPGCGEVMTRGFSSLLALSWIPPRTTERFAFVGEMLHGVALWQRVLPHRASYLLSYVCASCEINTIDYSRRYSRAEINDLAQG